MAYAVEIRNLHFSFGDLEVLSGLELDIPRGQVVAILGGSGSGKSTLLKLIGAHCVAVRGTVKVEARRAQAADRGALQAAARDRHDVPDLGPVHRPFGVREHRLPGPRKLRSAREDLVRRLVLMKLHAVGLRGAHAMMPADLSGGMTRRAPRAPSPPTRS